MIKVSKFFYFSKTLQCLTVGDADGKFKKLKKIYEIAGSSDRLEVEEFDGEHSFRGDKIFDFFKKWL